ncbi:MAG TPA: J domain-containing protein [Candidatus Limnocylindrales bacterium]|jgi:curved DNA-binding protein CbpA|nr:J domain-containing protein [Candidatus Limnocylindrales bacterium]
MSDERFRGDPYRVLGVAGDASASQIKRRWRELAREHHPDRAAGDREEAGRLTARMARINAAYDLLRDAGRRSRYDSTPEGRRARAGARADGPVRPDFADWAESTDGPAGPPPPPRTPPVTGRFDTSPQFRPRNATIHGSPYRPQGCSTRQRARHQPDELRASTPSGPVERHRAGRRQPPPTLGEARETELAFGKFRGYTLGEIALLEPTYIDWLAQAVTRDHELVRAARVVQADLDHQGVVRRSRPPTPGWGSRATE